MSVKPYRPLRRTILGLACWLALGSSASFAQSKPVETLLPNDPFLVVTWDGVEPHREAWKKTAAYESLHGSGLGPVLEKWLDFGISQVPAKEAVRIRRLMDRMIKTGMSVSISAPADAAIPLPYVLLIVHEGQELEADFADSFRQLAEDEGIKIKSEKRGSRTINIAEVPKAPPGLEFGWWVEGKHLVLAGGFGAIGITTGTADGERPNITTSEIWKKYHVSGEPAGFELSMLGWLDVATLLKTYGDIPLPDSPNPQMPLTVRALAQVAGLDGVSRLVFQRGYRGRASWSVSNLEAGAPRKGAFGLFDGPDLSLADLPPLPGGCSAFYAASIDWPKFYSEAIETAKRAAKLESDDALQEVEQGVNSIPSILGFNPGTDVFNTFGTVTCIYNDSSNGYLGIGPVIAIKLKDAARLKKTIDDLLKQVGGSGDVEVKEVERNGHHLRHLLIARTGFGPAILIEPEWFVIGLNPQVVEAFAMRLDKRLDRWEPSAAEKEGLAEMPQKFTSICISQPQKLYSLVVAMAPTAIRLAEFAMRENRVIPRDAHLPISVSDLPPAELVDRPLFPRITIGTSGKEGFRWTTRASGPTE